MFGLGKNKIRVWIIGGYLPKKKMCEYYGNKVIIQQQSRKRGAEYSATFDNSCLVPYKSGFPPFRSVKHQLYLKAGAFECVSWADPKETKAPTASTRDIRNFSRANAIFRAGNPPTEKKTIIYLMLGAVIILSFINLLVASGNLRFG